MEIIKLDNVTKIYNSKNKEDVEALNSITISFSKGKLYAIMGKSGSGKTTLINIIGLLDDISEGSYYFKDKDVSTYDEYEKAEIRNKSIGFIFQSYYLDENLTAYENIILPGLKNKDLPNDKLNNRALELLEKFDLADRKKHYPNELSGGEQQRVAIARALINDPNIIIADEPTGNLDEENEKIVFAYLKEISKSGKCIIVVSHNKEIKKYCDEAFELKDGKLL